MIVWALHCNAKPSMKNTENAPKPLYAPRDPSREHRARPQPPSAPPDTAPTDNGLACQKPPPPPEQSGNLKHKWGSPKKTKLANRNSAKVRKKRTIHGKARNHKRRTLRMMAKISLSDVYTLRTGRTGLICIWRRFHIQCFCVQYNDESQQYNRIVIKERTAIAKDLSHLQPQISGEQI